MSHKVFLVFSGPFGCLPCFKRPPKVVWVFLLKNPFGLHKRDTHSFPGEMPFDLDNFPRDAHSFPGEIVQIAQIIQNLK